MGCLFFKSVFTETFGGVYEVCGLVGWWALLLPACLFAACPAFLVRLEVLFGGYK